MTRARLARHRVVVDSDWLDAQPLEEPIVLPTTAAHRVFVVLRLDVGQQVAVFDGAGTEAEATVVEHQRVVLKSRRASEAGESPLTLNLLVGLPKGDRWELIVQKATELGATTLRPVYTERVVRRLPDDRAVKRLVRWQKIADEAARQSERSCAARVLPPLDLTTALTETSSRCCLVAAPGGGALTDVDLTKVAEVSCLLGPEGGLTDEEVRLAAEHGFVAVSLGPRILRVETAAITMAALVQHLAGDLV